MICLFRSVLHGNPGLFGQIVGLIDSVYIASSLVNSSISLQLKLNMLLDDGSGSSEQNDRGANLDLRMIGQKGINDTSLVTQNTSGHSVATSDFSH